MKRRSLSGSRAIPVRPPRTTRMRTRKTRQDRFSLLEDCGSSTGCAMASIERFLRRRNGCSMTPKTCLRRSWNVMPALVIMLSWPERMQMPARRMPLSASIAMRWSLIAMLPLFTMRWPCSCGRRTCAGRGDRRARRGGNSRIAAGNQETGARDFLEQFCIDHAAPEQPQTGCAVASGAGYITTRLPGAQWKLSQRRIAQGGVPGIGGHKRGHGMDSLTEHSGR